MRVAKTPPAGPMNLAIGILCTVQAYVIKGGCVEERAISFGASRTESGKRPFVKNSAWLAPHWAPVLERLEP